MEKHREGGVESTIEEKMKDKDDAEEAQQHVSLRKVQNSATATANATQPVMPAPFQHTLSTPSSNLQKAAFILAFSCQGMSAKQLFGKHWGFKFHVVECVSPNKTYLLTQRYF